MLPHTYQTDGLLLQAELSCSGGVIDDPASHLGHHLVISQKDGYWRHESIPDKIPAWAIMECVVGLNRFLLEVNREGRLAYVEEAMRDVSDSMKALTAAQSDLKARVDRQTGMLADLASLWKYRYVLATIYLVSIYFFVRSSFTLAQPYADLTAAALGVALTVLQLLAGRKR